MPSNLHIPIVEEEARVDKRSVATEQVRVRTMPVDEDVVVREKLLREQVEVIRVPIDREVAAAPATRTEGDVTIVPVLEERLVVEKRLFLIEELHVRRSARFEPITIPMTLRRTQVDVERTSVEQENH